MRTVIDGKTDLRPHNSNDVSSSPLPYAESRLGLTITTLGADTTITAELTDANWGSGLDYYIAGWLIYRSNLLNMPNNEGLLIKLSIQETGELLYLKTFQKAEALVYTYNSGEGHLFFNSRFKSPKKVLSTETLQIDFWNYTAETFVGAGNVLILLLTGSAI